MKKDVLAKVEFIIIMLVLIIIVVFGKDIMAASRNQRAALE